MEERECQDAKGRHCVYEAHRLALALAIPLTSEIVLSDWRHLRFEPNHVHVDPPWPRHESRMKPKALLCYALKLVHKACIQ